jgi:hypothetical protein
MSAAPCERTPEPQVFRAQCANEIEKLDRQLAATKYRRGLHISWTIARQYNVAANSWGVGHTVAVMLQLHALCRRLRRYCYVGPLYDTEYDVYFGYANGESWVPELMELDRYPRATASGPSRGCSSNASFCLKVGCDQSCAGTPLSGSASFFAQLYRTLAAHDDQPLLELNIKGWMPMAAAEFGACANTDSVGPLCSVPRSSDTPATVCFNRYVTDPRRPNRPALKRLAATPAPSIAVHLRTGFADADDETIRLVPPDPAASARWVAAACGSSRPFADGQPRFLLSDSPGLVSHLTGTHAHLSANPRSKRQAPASRNWRAPLASKAATYDDLVVAGMATELQVAPQRVLVNWRPGMRNSRTQHRSW